MFYGASGIFVYQVGERTILQFVAEPDRDPSTHATPYHDSRIDAVAPSDQPLLMTSVHVDQRTIKNQNTVYPTTRVIRKEKVLLPYSALFGTVAQIPQPVEVTVNVGPAASSPGTVQNRSGSIFSHNGAQST